MLIKIKDSLDTEVSMVILIDTIEQLSVLAEVLVSIGKERLSYEVYKDDITAYMMEMRMPYNRYIKMMSGLQSRGYNLRQESKVDIFKRMYKM